MRLVSYATVGALVALVVCSGSKSGHSISAQPFAKASLNGMLMMAVPLSRERALAVMKARHDGMESIGDSAKAVHRAQSGPDFVTIRSNAAKIAQLSQQASGWFPAGTGPDVAKTRAKPDIWQNSEDFALKLRNFQAAARNFNAAASVNDAAAINAAFGQLNGACKACHDKYRAEEQH
jgi:cytochrome c556